MLLGVGKGCGIIGGTLEVMGRIRLRWAVAFLSALAALDLAAFASDFDSTALSGAVDFQATYAAVQYLVLGDIVCFGFTVSLGYSVG